MYVGLSLSLFCMAPLNADRADLPLLLYLPPSNLLSPTRSSPVPWAAQPAGPERGQLPHHFSPPAEGHRLCEPHRAAGPRLHPPDLLRQLALHPQQRVAASAAEDQQQLGSTAAQVKLHPVGCPPQLPASTRILCWHRRSSSGEQNHSTHAQVRPYWPKKDF